MKNGGMKGAPADTIHPGQSVVLAHHEGSSGMINAIWFAQDQYNNPKGIGALRISIYWDDSETPAVDAPFEEFFCHAAHHHKHAFENWLFSSPEGRSFNCFVPMPFKTGCKVILTNVSEHLNVSVFYCLQMTCNVELPDDFLYFHCLHQPMRRTRLLEDFEILPTIHGTGRYLGTNVQMYSGEGYAGTWFGEGEVKIYLDGDDTYPSLIGTGTEDYILSAWGQGVFSSLHAGCTLNETDDEGRIRTAFYRVHVADPIYFSEECRVTLQQMGGANASSVRNVIKNGAPYRLTSTTLDTDTSAGQMLWGDDADANHPNAIWVNFMREDYVSAVAYFYLDRPAR